MKKMICVLFVAGLASGTAWARDNTEQWVAVHCTVVMKNIATGHESQVYQGEAAAMDRDDAWKSASQKAYAACYDDIERYDIDRTHTCKLRSCD